jgi:hypothetical protein
VIDGREAFGGLGVLHRFADLVLDDVRRRVVRRPIGEEVLEARAELQAASWRLSRLRKRPQDCRVLTPDLPVRPDPCRTSAP